MFFRYTPNQKQKKPWHHIPERWSRDIRWHLNQVCTTKVARPDDVQRPVRNSLEHVLRHRSLGSGAEFEWIWRGHWRLMASRKFTYCFMKISYVTICEIKAQQCFVGRLCMWYSSRTSIFQPISIDEFVQSSSHNSFIPLDLFQVLGWQCLVKLLVNRDICQLHKHLWPFLGFDGIPMRKSTTGIILDWLLTLFLRHLLVYSLQIPTVFLMLTAATQGGLVEQKTKKRC